MGDDAFSEMPSLVLMKIPHLRCRACRGSIEPAMTAYGSERRHKCRPYKALKKKLPYYQVTKLEATLLCKLALGNSLLIIEPGVSPGS